MTTVRLYSLAARYGVNVDTLRLPYLPEPPGGWVCRGSYRASDEPGRLPVCTDIWFEREPRK